MNLLIHPLHLLLYGQFQFSIFNPFTHQQRRSQWNFQFMAPFGHIILQIAILLKPLVKLFLQHPHIMFCKILIFKARKHTAQKFFLRHQPLFLSVSFLKLPKIPKDEYQNRHENKGIQIHQIPYLLVLYKKEKINVICSKQKNAK